MRQNSLEDELLGSRILFLLTYDTKFDFDKLFEEDDLAQKINKVLFSAMLSSQAHFVAHKN